ncbi:MAG: divalent metal cation transporter [Cryomorphaceae bacterium]|nr:MAG: divalent metal cation transporter [Cryomorphaceae bacterium]
MKLYTVLRTLGPGILFASTAIGVSHLVQSTRAGADYGFTLLWAVVAANVLKFPFFEFGSRYASATGESLIDGYKRIGKGMLWLYLAVTIGSMFFVAAAVSAVGAGFFDHLFGLSDWWKGFPLYPVALLIALCLFILIWGQYKMLDKTIKIVGSMMVITTLVAFVLVLKNGRATPVIDFQASSVWEPAGIAFLIALMGWMPTAVDLSTWNSLWTLERIRSSGFKPSLRATLLEFHIGYWLSAILAVCFLTLGAYLVFGTGKEMPEGSAAFSKRVIELYTAAMGGWSYYLIATAAFSIMFGTVIGVLDGFARALERTLWLLADSPELQNRMHKGRKVYVIGLLTIALGAFGVIAWFGNQLKALVDVATTLSFLVAPLIAIVNLRLVTRADFPYEARPGLTMRLLSYAGIAFLTGFSLLYLWNL